MPSHVLPEKMQDSERRKCFLLSILGIIFKNIKK